MRTALRDHMRLVAAVAAGVLSCTALRALAPAWFPSAVDVAFAVASVCAMVLAARVHNAERGVAEDKAARPTRHAAEAQARGATAAAAADPIVEQLKRVHGGWSTTVEALFPTTYAAIAFSTLARFIAPPT